jgi:oligoribonuclease
MVWMDLEMTGLDPAKEVIVEIATLITDDELNIIAEGPDLVVHQPEHLLAAMDPFVVNMHTKSGLLNEIRASTLSLEEAGRITLDFIKSHVGAPKTVPLCGNSIGTDRRFLAAYLPDIENYLHYRSIDVSTATKRSTGPALGVSSSARRAIMSDAPDASTSRSLLSAPSANTKRARSVSAVAPTSATTSSVRVRSATVVTFTEQPGPPMGRPATIW